MKKLIIMSVSLVVTLGVVVAGVSASDREFTSITEPLVAVSSPTEDQEGNKESKNQSSDLITPEEAGEIALDYLGTGMIEEIELEQKKGRLAYEVEIDTYDEDGDIYVDARTGEILYVEDDLGKMLNKKNTHPETTDNKGNMLIEKKQLRLLLTMLEKAT
ncbi:PepSY domain-containing protein [Halalkalibacter akibai]|uniref:PepSY domain-containing protein n=1 Tax=Halalkalibacter akibai (strain ATCC 43226 / DSM 21942 / CIP 109018 / JCM 9157 / 1139) TaxID=1236973 RepID=W4QVI5_HALA3|nr:PepSY domain-containing protein [Halalkalibacter akibai]GAE35638.1 hypothetical protein JCM9157_2755 [Halalkalibacter akibai JCM 9157]